MKGPVDLSSVERAEPRRDPTSLMSAKAPVEPLRRSRAEPRKACLIAAAMCILPVTLASADQMVVATWDRFINVCGQAIQDGPAFVANIPTWAPAGSYKTVTMADRSQTKTSVHIDGFRDAYDRTEVNGRVTEGCNVSFVSFYAANKNSLTNGAMAAAAFEQHIASSLGAQNLWGGQYPEIYRPEALNAPVQLNQENWRYKVTGGFPDPKLIADVQIVGGYMSAYVGKGGH